MKSPSAMIFSIVATTLIVLVNICGVETEAVEVGALV